MSKNRFKRIYHESIPLKKHFNNKEIIEKVEIIKDQHTGVLYGAFEHEQVNQMTVIPLIDADGKPLVDVSE